MEEVKGLCKEGRWMWNLGYNKYWKIEKVEERGVVIGLDSGDGSITHKSLVDWELILSSMNTDGEDNECVVGTIKWK